MSVVGPWEALGTRWYLEFFEAVDEKFVLEESQALLSEFEKNYSRFLSDSWVSRLNRDQEIADPPAEFVELLNLSIDYFKKTGGVFNITVGEQIAAAGYDKNYTFVSQKETPELLQLTGVVRVSPERVILEKGQIDLGGIGKGYAIDKLARHLKKVLGLKYFLINGGGDIYATSDQGASIEIGLAHPTDQTKIFGKTELKDQGFAASSPYVRAWRDPKTGKEYNHLLTENKVASYVIAPSATEADVWATTLAIKPILTPDQEIFHLLLADGKAIHVHPFFQLN